MANSMDKTNKKPNDKMKRLLGFELSDFKTFDSFVKLMNRPEDGSSLAIFRIFFGFIMMLDIPDERGMSQADIEYGDLNQDCQFPLFDFLKPLEAQYMVMIYTIMFIGAGGIMFGFKYRLSCLCFLIPYWYLFFLDKTTWNNHSYLYGVIAFQLLITDANRCLSVDAILNKNINNTHVPLWNYCLIRTQVFLVYFIAGLKKTEFDWLAGYSMGSLGEHWVFDPLKYFLSEEQITWFIVHGGGFFIDFFGGFLLFFDATRLYGTIMVTMFHIMNSRMFNIGMFPYTMLVTTAIFYSNNWPKRLVNHLTKSKYTNYLKVTRLSSHCIYEKEVLKTETQSQFMIGKEKEKEKIKESTPISNYHKFFAIFTMLFIAEQCFLPYSHWITKGYNNWTNGLYGYSWDMMVHSWHTQHIKIEFVDKEKNETHFLHPKVWTSRRRWSSHGDMIYQYAKCIEERLAKNNYKNIELYMDIWRSMNHRFNQRQIDPRVDLTKVEWSPFKPVKWIMPLLTELSDWRKKMIEIEADLGEKNNNLELTFVADFPGLKLENYIAPELNTTIEVLHGKVNVEFLKENKKKNHTLKVGDKIQLPSRSYHNVYTVSKTPSCFVYIYINDTLIFYSNLYDYYSKSLLIRYNEVLEQLKAEDPGNSLDKLMIEAHRKTMTNHDENAFIGNITNPVVNSTVSDKEELYSLINSKNLSLKVMKLHFMRTFANQIDNTKVRKQITLFSKTYNRLISYLYAFKRSFTMTYYAAKSIVFNEDFMSVLQRDFYTQTVKSTSATKSA